MDSFLTPVEGSLWSKNIIWETEDEIEEHIAKKVEEEIAEKVEEEIAEKVEEEIVKEVEEEIAKEVEEEIETDSRSSRSSRSSGSRRRSYSSTCSSEESEKSVRGQDSRRSLKEALKKEKKANAFLEEALKKEENAYDSLLEDYKRAKKSRDFLEEALTKEEKANDNLIEDLKKEKKANDNLIEDLKKEKKAKALLKEALEKQKRSKDELKNALEQERKQKHALEKSLKKVQVDKDCFDAEMDLMKTQVADLKKSLESYQEEKARLEGTITEITAELQLNMKLIVDLKNDLEVSAQYKKEMAERETVNCSEIKALQECLMKQQEESLEKDKEIKSLHFKIQTNFEANDIVSSLQERVKQQASDLKEERAKNCDLKRDYEAAISQQQKDQDKLDHLIQDNQDLISEKKMLQDELHAGLKKRQLDQRQLQEDREDRAHSRLEEAIQKEKARFLEASEKIQMQKEELSQKTLALEKSLMAENHLKSSLKKEKKHYEQLLQRQESANTFLMNQLKEASAKSERLMYDLQTLKMDNADIRGRFNALEKDNDQLNSENSSLIKCHQEATEKKNETIFECQRTITELECMVNRLKAQQSEDKTRQATVEVALKYETTRNSELQQTVDQITSSLDKERATCEKYRVELKESLKRQIEILEEKQKFKFRQNSDTEVRLNQPKTALDETTKALHHLQQEYTELGKRHGDISSDYRELLKTHSDLKFKYERLSYAQGNFRPVFSPPPFTAMHF